jgi:hypothetical protein
MALHASAEIKVFERQQWDNEKSPNKSERKTPTGILEPNVKED